LFRDPSDRSDPSDKSDASDTFDPSNPSDPWARSDPSDTLPHRLPWSAALPSWPEAGGSGRLTILP